MVKNLPANVGDMDSGFILSLVWEDPTCHGATSKPAHSNH